MTNSSRSGPDDGRRGAGRGAGDAERTLFQVRTVGSDADGRVVVEVAGEIDRETAPALQACLTTHLRPAGPLLVVDLTGVVFLNVSGLRVLARTHQQALDGGQQLVVVTGDRHRGPRRALQAAGLLELLTRRQVVS